MIRVKEFRCRDTALFDRNLPEKAMYEILIYQWWANVTIRADRNAKCSREKVK